jgi:ribose-phosphate pyrophosphokinase
LIDLTILTHNDIKNVSKETAWMEESMIYREKTIETIPVGPLGLIPLKSCMELGEKVNNYLVKWRQERESEHKSTIAFAGYQRDSYIISAKTPRFGSGEAKGVVEESVRGDDLYIMVDVCNYSLTYSLCGMTNHMSPDDHFQDLKRVIAAAAGKARRINVIMPFLYEGRQHKRSNRESLDCALALQELANMGVENIITFDAHDPRVQNAIPRKGFETVQPTYQFIKHLLKEETDLQIDSDHMMVISPDEGGMSRAVYFANVLGLDMGMFYKRRDYTQIVDGRNPIVAHEFLGSSVEGKDVIIVDDMISSGESMRDVAAELKRRKARKVFIFSTFGLFTNGLGKFDQFYEEGIIDRILTTNLVYQSPELLSKPYYTGVDMSKYIALIIDNLNHDASLSELLNPTGRINRILEKYRER